MRLSEKELAMLTGGKGLGSPGRDGYFSTVEASLLNCNVTVNSEVDSCVIRMDGAIMPSLNKVLRWHPIKEYQRYNRTMRAVLATAISNSGTPVLDEGMISIIRSGRARLLDVDNIPPKFIIDGIRHCGVLRDDSPRYIVAEIIMPQTKVKKGEEYIEISLIRPTGDLKCLLQ